MSANLPSARPEAGALLLSSQILVGLITLFCVILLFGVELWVVLDKVRRHWVNSKTYNKDQLELQVYLFLHLVAVVGMLVPANLIVFAVPFPADVLSCDAVAKLLA
jgi:hypothetical protein